MRLRDVIWIVLAVTAMTAACGRSDDAASQAHELETHLLSPCCYRQTLADHDSPVAAALRAEIRARVAAREAPSSIERDLVRRYGTAIRALPEGRDPRWLIAVMVIGMSALGLVVIVRFVKRRRVPPVPPSEVLAWSEYDDRLDDELLAVD